MVPAYFYFSLCDSSEISKCTNYPVYALAKSKQRDTVFGTHIRKHDLKRCAPHFPRVPHGCLLLLFRLHEKRGTVHEPFGENFGQL